MSPLPEVEEVLRQTRAIHADFQRRFGDAPGALFLGDGCRARLGECAAGVAAGRRAWLLAGRRRAAADDSAGFLRAAGFSVWMAPPVAGEPTVALVDELARRARAEKPDVLVAVGGGSVLDAAKAAAALATNPGSALDYLEGIGQGARMENDPLPWLAAPTTAGTGAEMTRNAVLDSPAHRVKRSLRDARLVARAALLDPELTRDAPRNVTAAAGLDAITQLFESALSRKARPETTAAALAALPWARAALPRVLRDPADMPARAAMLMAAGVSGLCLAHSGLGLAHALAAPLGGRRGVAHGVACGALLPHVLRHNRAAAGPALDAACAAWLGASPGPTATERALEELAALVADGDLPLDWRAADWTAGELDALARDAVGSSLAGNPRPMSAGDVREFLRGLIGV